MFILIVFVVLGCSNDRSAVGTASTIDGRQEPVWKRLTPPVSDEQWAQYVVRAEPPPPIYMVGQAKIRHSLSAFHSNQSEESRARLASAQWHFAKKTTPGVYAQLGRALGLEMLDQLARGLRATTPAKRSQALAAYQAIGGRFDRHAQQAGLLATQLRSNREKAMLQSLFMRRWLSALPAKADAFSHLLPEEHLWYLRYLVESENAAPLSRRLDAISEIARAVPYPGIYNRASLLARHGRYKAALDVLKDATQNDERQLANQIREYVSR